MDEDINYAVLALATNALKLYVLGLAVKLNCVGFSSKTVWPFRTMEPFIIPPAEIGIDSFETPAGILKVRDNELDVESVTVEG